MFYYIYRINNALKSNLENNNAKTLNKLEGNLIFEDYSSEIIKGSVNLKNDSLVKNGVDFEIDLKYCFLFVKTNYQRILNKALLNIEAFFNENLGGELENFLPLVSKEHELICNSKEFNLKFLYDGQIVDCEDNENLEKKYCLSQLPKDYSLIEADINLENDLSFIYLRKCLIIPNEKSEDKILNIFKRAMA